MNTSESQSPEFETGDFVAYQGPYESMHYGIVFHVEHKEVSLKPLFYEPSNPFNPWSVSPHTLKISLEKFSKNLQNVVSHVIDEIMVDNKIFAKRKTFIEEKINVLHKFRGLMNNDIIITEPVRSLFGEAQMREIERELMSGSNKVALSEDLQRIDIRLYGLPKKGEFLSLAAEERKAVFLYRVSNDTDFYVMTKRDKLPEEVIYGPDQQIVVVLINDRVEKRVYIDKMDLNVLTRWGAKLDFDFQPLFFDEMKFIDHEISDIRVMFDA